MDLKKTWLTMGVFLLVAIVVWVGFSIYFSLSKVDINPNAQSYIRNIRPQFDSALLDGIKTKVEALPVSPSTFTNLLNQTSK